jgi:Uma2 family endonuclease
MARRSVALGAMRTVVLGDPPAPIARWLQRRRALGQDLFDEVWEGDYHVAPAPHGRHGDIDDQLAAFLRPLARERGLWPSGPLNIGRPDDYRVPDRAYLHAREPRAFQPSAAIVVEIVAPGDETYAKLDFYAAQGVEEVLVVDPGRAIVEWYARRGDRMQPAGRSDLLGLTEDDLAVAIDWPPGS